MSVPLGLTPDMLLVFGIIFFTGILFLSEMVRIDVVASLVLVLLGLTQLVPEDRLFSGFASNAVISLIGVMIIGAGLERSGIMLDLASWITRFGGDKERRINVLLMLASGLMAGILRSVGAVALLLPVVTRISRRTGISKSRLLMPMAQCAILGSTLTMVGTGPLIILNSLLDSHWEGEIGAPEPFGLFDVLPIGLALLLLGMVYFAVFHHFILPKPHKKQSAPGSSSEHFGRNYGVGGEYLELRVKSSSPLVNMELRQLENILDPSIGIIGLKMGNQYWMPPLRVDTIKSGMVIALIGDRALVEVFAQEHALRLSSCLTAFIERLNPGVSGLCEVVVPPSSNLVGEDFKNQHMRRKHGVQVLAIHRGDKIYRGQELREVTLKPGDTLGIFCEWERMVALEKNPDYVVVTSDFPHEEYNREKKTIALSFTLLGIFLILTGYVSLPLGLLLGALGMVFSGVLTIDEAYSSVSWRTVFLIAGLMPLGIAMQESGADVWIIRQVFQDLSHLPITVILALLALITTLLSLVLSGIGATILLVPLALNLAEYFQSDPRLFALMVALSASNAFIFPTHQANALITGPGHYHIRDFMRAGGVLTILYITTLLLLVPRLV